MSSAKEGGEDTEEDEDGYPDSQEMDTQELQPTGGKLSSLRATPMDAKDEGVSTSSSKSTGVQQKTGTSQPTMVTRHNRRPSLEKKTTKLFGERLLTKAILLARYTSDEELGKQWKASSKVVLRTVNRYRGGGNIGVGDRVKKPLTPTSPKKIPNPKIEVPKTRISKEKCAASTGDRITYRWTLLDLTKTCQGILPTYWTHCVASLSIQRGPISYGFDGERHRWFSITISILRAGDYN